MDGARASVEDIHAQGEDGVVPRLIFLREQCRKCSNWAICCWSVFVLFVGLFLAKVSIEFRNGLHITIKSDTLTTEQMMSRKMGFNATALKNLVGQEHVGYWCRCTLETNLTESLLKNKGIIVFSGNKMGKSCMTERCAAALAATPPAVLKKLGAWCDCPQRDKFIEALGKFTVWKVDVTNANQSLPYLLGAPNVDEAKNNIEQVMAGKAPLLLYIHVSVKEESYYSKSGELDTLTRDLRQIVDAVPSSKFILEFSKQVLPHTAGSVESRSATMEMSLLTDREVQEYAKFRGALKDMSDEMVTKIGGRIGSIRDLNSVVKKWNADIRRLSDFDKAQMIAFYKTFVVDVKWDGKGIVSRGSPVFKDEWLLFAKKYVMFDEENNAWVFQSRYFKNVLDEVLKGMKGFKKYKTLADNYNREFK